jgi:hypothetical protein
MPDLKITGFSGANNVNNRFMSKTGVIEPQVILNADVNLSGELVQRAGQTLFISLPGAHSLWSCSLCMLCAANGILYRNMQGIAVNIGIISGPKYPLSFVEAEDKIYISNPYWQGVYDPSINSLTSWGIPLPPGPMLLSGSGNLPAGTYHVTMTNVVSNELSGNGPISDITLTTTGGIQILNRPSGALTWVTDADEGIFYLVGEVSQIVTLPTVEPLPSFLCEPPTSLENLCYAFGRMFGSDGQNTYYSEPFKLSWFKRAANIFKFDSTITLIAGVSTGLFIGTYEKTWFLTGTDPSKMTLSDAGAGSIKGTLAYCNNMPELGNVFGTPEKGYVDVPVWLTTEGYVAGNTSGKLYNLTKNKIKMGIPSIGASLYRNLDGVFQYLSSFRAGSAGSGAGAIDQITYNAFKDGKVDTHEKTLNGTTCRASFKDEVSCKVYRDGVEI